MNTPWLLWLLLALPLGGGTALAVIGRPIRRAAPMLAVAVATATLALAAAAAVTRPVATAPLFSGIAAGVGVDGLSAVMVLTVSSITVVVLLFSTGEFGDEDNAARFFGLMLIFAGAMLVTVTATTLALLLMGWEGMGAASYALIGYWWWEPRRVTAANVAFVTTRAADLGLYVAAGAAVAGGVPTLALADLPDAGRPWLSVITVGIVLAALGKSAQLPFSFWLSRAMQGPSPVSALLHSATMVAAGAYLLLRSHPLLAATSWAEPSVAWVGAVTALVLGLVAVAQTDVKQLLAASTCAQIGFMVLAAGTGGVAGGVLQLIAHAAVKSLLFLAAGAWLTALGTKSLPALRGAARSHRIVGITFTVGALSLAGLPPLSLWLTKDEVLASALQRQTVLYAAGLAAAIVSAVYSIKIIWYVWQPLPVNAAAGYDTERRGTRRVNLPSRLSLLVLVPPAAALGVLAVPALADPLRRTLGAVGEPTSTGWQLALSAALAVAASVLTWQWGTRPLPLPANVTSWLTRWLNLEAVIRRLLVQPVLALSRGLAWFDDRVLDQVVHAMASGVRATAGAAARLDDRGVDGLVTDLASGVRWLGQSARRPQTGQLHTYYAQAVAAFGLLTVIFVLVR